MNGRTHENRRVIHRRAPTIISRTCCLCAAVLAVATLLVVPFLSLTAPEPTPGDHSAQPSFTEVFLLDHALAILSLSLFSLGARIAPANASSRLANMLAIRPVHKRTDAPPSSMPLRIAGSALIWLGICLLIMGFQMSVVKAHTNLIWLVNLGLSFCAFPVFFAGLAVLDAARRPTKAASRAASMAGWMLHAVCWLFRVIGAAMAALYVLSTAITWVLPGADRPSFFITLAFYMSIAAVGVMLFRLGTIARHAARRHFGLATPMTSRAPHGTQQFRARFLQVTSVIMGVIAATLTLGGLRLTLGDLVRIASSAHDRPSPHALLLDIAIACLGSAAGWTALAARRAARRSLGLDVDVASLAPPPRRRRVHGWALRAAGWVMRLGGAVILVLACLGLRLTGSIPERPGYDGSPWYVLLVGFLTVGIAGAAVILFASIPAMVGNRYLANIITSPTGMSEGSYVLYLRPFSQDVGASALTPRHSNLNFFNNPSMWIAQSNRSHEERLSALFSEFGPLLAVGSPGEQVPGGAGASRMYLPLDDWKGTVGRLIENAGLIVLGTGPGPGTLWEYTEVLRRSHPTRLVLLVTDPIEYRRFKASSIAEAEGVLYEIKARYGESWETPILPELPNYATSRADRAFWFTSMVYFTEDCEPHMVSLNTSMVSGNFRMDNAAIKRQLRPLLEQLRNSGPGGSPAVSGQKR
ncbi:hypothetical protein ACH3WN_19390 [Streptomyces albogriseolus]|uniref:hypothetical protein n=1 Tax=Streptomyces albogriseolus TaxID=1887 RepID=UPI0037AB98EA